MQELTKIGRKARARDGAVCPVLAPLTVSGIAPPVGGTMGDVLAANNIKRFAFAEHYTGRDTPGEPGERPPVDERRKP